MRSKGKIASWNDEKGFGFIAPFDGGSPVFVHIRAFRHRSRRPLANDVVTFSVGKDEQGRTRAVKATLAGDTLSVSMRRFRTVAEVLFAVLFLGVAGLAVLTRQIPSIVAVAYGVVSVLTFLAYAIDKSAAQNGRWRTSEGTLHLLALAGGWPGALIAQQTLRHKSAKLSFRFFFWLTVLLNCAALVWLNTPDGQATLEKLHFFQL